MLSHFPTFILCTVILAIVIPPTRAELGCPPCSEPSPLRLAYLINIHNSRTLEDAVPLLNAVSAPNNVVLVHIDKKFPEDAWKSSELETILSNCKCGTREIHSETACVWGEWSMNDPVLWAFDYLTFNLKNTFDKFVTLSGDSLPTLENPEMGRVMEQCLGGRNVVTSVWGETGFLPTPYDYFPEEWHKRRAYSRPVLLDYQENGVSKSTSAKVHFGSQWMMLEPDFVNYIGESMRDENSLANSLKKAYLDQGRVVTDETFFPTLLMESERFNTTYPLVAKGEGIDIPGCEWLKSARYERMDEHSPSAFGDLPNTQRYKAIEGVEPRAWGPYFLGIYDIKDIKDSGALFIRKVSREVEPNIYLIFPKQTREHIDALPDISWSKNINLEITERPTFNWFQGRETIGGRAKKKKKKKEEL